jgi:hypothetical protein
MSLIAETLLLAPINVAASQCKDRNQPGVIDNCVERLPDMVTFRTTVLHNTNTQIAVCAQI